MRDAVEHLAHAQIPEAWSALDACGAIGRVQGTRAAVQAAVDAWEAEKAAKPGADHLLLARTHASLRLLNSEVRRRRRERGELAGDDVTVEAAPPSGQPFALPLAIGDRLRFGTRVDRLGVINGTTGIVEAVKVELNGQAQLQARVGDRSLTFSTREIVDRRGSVRLAHDYGATVSSAQGLTAESCTVLVEPSFDRHDLYVAASRSRGATHLVVDESALDLLARGARRPDAPQGPTTSEEREAALLQRLSRERIKATALGFDRAEPLQARSSAELKQTRPRELGHEL